VTVVLYTGD